MEEITQKIPTPRQTKAARAVIENIQSDNPLPVGEILKSVDYGTGLQQNPNRVINSLGFKQAIRDLGLTEELITSSLVEDIKLKPQNRVQEMTLGSKILGMTNDEEKPKEKGTNIYNYFFNKDIQQDVRNLEDKIKDSLKKKNVQAFEENN